MILEYIKEINSSLLWDELHTQFGYGVGFFDLQYRTEDSYVKVQVEDWVSSDDVESVIQAHDSTKQTEIQQREQEYTITKATLKDIIENRINWHESNPVTQENVFEVIQRMQLELSYVMKIIRKDL